MLHFTCNFSTSQIILFVLYRCWRKKRPEKEESVEINAWDEANMLTKQPNHFVRVNPKEQMPYRCELFSDLRAAKRLMDVFAAVSAPYRS